MVKGRGENQFLVPGLVFSGAVAATGAGLLYYAGLRADEALGDLTGWLTWVPWAVFVVGVAALVALGGVKLWQISRGAFWITVGVVGLAAGGILATLLRWWT
jgi:hypothetical protein